MSVTVTDLFCGAGGSSIGAETAGAKLRFALNHWERAIETHSANFQDADHSCNDIAALTTAQIRRMPDSDILLASPECTNHSLAKGARRRKPQAGSLWEDGPAGDAEQDRSRATMWDVPRFVEQKLMKGKPYKFIVVENVVDAAKWGPDDNGQLFDAWLGAMAALGYRYETVWLNSMFVPPTPQSRDRMYVVFWLKAMRKPDLTFSPPSWCPSCEVIVDGKQVFKKHGRRWGRYGAQYLFRCPECTGVVLPGAAPAATAIDWTLPAPLIGERARPLATATRERIRRGLQRLTSEPFAIRMGGTGNPRPLTLPLITLTARHELAMITPVAGNTFERTPGNRARNAGTQPLDTVHGTLDRAMVLPPMGGVDPRNADTQPVPTQTTSTRAALVTAGGAWSTKPTRDDEPIPTLTGTESRALVMANIKNNVPKDADQAPVPVLRTGGSVGVIMRNNTPRGDSGQMCTPDHEPFRTLTTSGTQSLVVPYTAGNQPRITDREPLDTQTTRDCSALLVPFTRNGRPRDVHFDQAPTIATEGPPALVLSEGDIDACGFRMFDLHEIAVAMSMRDHVDGSIYEVIGNKRERMAQYGNAVTPPVMQALVGRCMAAMA